MSCGPGVSRERGRYLGGMIAVLRYCSLCSHTKHNITIAPGKNQYHISPSARSSHSHPVREKPASSVVSITVPEEMTPSWPMATAMT